MDKEKKTYYETNKDKFKEYNKKYNENNKEKRKEYNENNKENRKEYYEKYKEQILEKQKEYNKNNKEKRKEIKKKYRDQNLEKIKDKSKEYYDINKEKKKEYYDINKEKISEYRKEYYENNIEKFKCRSCRLFFVQKKSNYLCSYCNPDTPTRQKTKEMAVKTFLEECNYTFIYNKKCNLDKSCQTYYPDFLIDCNKFFVIVECDEDGHKTYDKECEKIRENNICFALGLPCVFIRYNPDKKKVKMETKQKVLKSYIDYYTKKETSDNVVEYLFY